MNRKRRLILKLVLTPPVPAGLLFSMLIVACTHTAGQEKQVLSLEAQIPLPSVKGRIDHFGVDVTGKRLLVAAVENHRLEVVNLKAGQRVHTISDLAEPQGVFYDPTTNHLFVACGLDGVTKLLDGDTFQVLATVKFPDDADFRHRADRRFHAHARCRFPDRSRPVAWVPRDEKCSPQVKVSE